MPDSYFDNIFNFSIILLIIFGSIVVAYLIREIVLWYWNINKIVSLLEKIERNTFNKSKDEDDDGFI